jgi:HK97 gp10 family phage protein
MPKENMTAQQGVHIDRIDGVPEFVALMKQMNDELKVKTLKATFKKAAKPMLIAARNLAPMADVAVKVRGYTVQPGHLKKSIRLFAAPSSKDWQKNQPAVIIKPQKNRRESIEKSAYWGAFVEYGRKKKGGDKTKAEKFFKRAFDGNKTQFVSDVNKEMRLFVEKYNRK